jgi:hypothetical protein
MAQAVQVSCRVCDQVPADRYFDGDGPLCDGCFDERISAGLGLPRVVEMPEPTTITGPDGCHHVMRYRAVREHNGIVVELHEVDVPDDGSGYQFSVIGDPDADMAELVAAVRQHAQREIGRRYLDLPPTPGPVGGPQLTGDELRGRIETDPEASDSAVLVVDGRPVAWSDLSRALSSFEGFLIRVTIEENCLDVRSGTGC